MSIQRSESKSDSFFSSDGAAGAIPLLRSFTSPMTKVTAVLPQTNMKIPEASASAFRHAATRQRLVRVAQGQEPGDLLIQNVQVVQPATGEIFAAEVLVAEGRIAALSSGALRSGALSSGHQAAQVIDGQGAYLAPGFIDGHIHIESSLLTPGSFAAAVLPRGTTTIVAEPHEVVNVLGLGGLDWMLEAGRQSGMRIYASAPSCVPASEFEQGGASISGSEIQQMLRQPGVLGLAELMNYPGLLRGNPEVWEVMQAGLEAQYQRGQRMDGHAPGLGGSALQAYVAAGLHSDHEATTPEEARERLRLGLWLMVREGSAARNLQALLPVLRQRPRRAMLVSDDVSVDELLELGHLDRLLRNCVAGGLPPAEALALVTCNPAEYWGLHDLGLVAPGYHADFVLLRDLKEFEVLATFVGGVQVAGQPTPELHSSARLPQPTWHTPPLADLGLNLGPQWTQAQFDVPAHWPVMQVYPDQILTGKGQPGTGDTKLVVADRYGRAQHATCWTSGTGLTHGTLGISVLHDAHNAAFLGGTDADIRLAGQELERLGGGIVVVAKGRVLTSLALPYAGLMTDLPPQQAADQLRQIGVALRGLGCTLPYPVTTLSFLGLSVIPALKLTPQGLLDVQEWVLYPEAAPTIAVPTVTVPTGQI